MHKQILEAIIEIFGMFLIGAGLRHFKFLKHEDLDKLSKLVFDVLFPALIFTSIAKGLDPSRFRELWVLPLIGFGFMAFGGLIGFILRYGLVNRGEGRLQTFHMFCAVNNYSFLPIIVISNLWGDEYLPLLFIMTIGSTIGLWTVGVSLLAGSDLKRCVKNILSPNIFAVAIGILMVVFHIHLPDVVLRITGKAGSAAVPLILLIVGAALYSSARNLFQEKWDIFYLSFCRLLLIPLINIMIIKQLHLPEDIYRVSFAVAIMPVSVSASVMTIRYGGSPEFAGQAAVISTVLSIFTMPLLLYLL